MLEASPHSDAADLRDLADEGGQLVFARPRFWNRLCRLELINSSDCQYVLAIEAGAMGMSGAASIYAEAGPAVVKASSGYFGG